MNGDPSRDVHVPGWALIVGGLLVAIASAAFAKGITVGQYEEHQRTLDYRICRIEAALKITPWPSCNQPQ